MNFLSPGAVLGEGVWAVGPGVVVQVPALVHVPVAGCCAWGMLPARGTGSPVPNPERSGPSLGFVRIIYHPLLVE